MRPKSLSRLLLSTTLMFFGGAVLVSGGPIGCESVSPVKYDASTNPTEEAARLEQDIKTGFAQDYDVLDQKDFANAQKKLAKAKSEMASNSKPETILRTLGEARAYLNRAKERAEALQERAKGILEARNAALGAGIRNFPAVSEAFKKQDDELRAEVDKIAKGKTSPERWSNLQRGYLDLELKAIQEAKLGDAKAKVYGAIKNGAMKNTPNMLKQAERDIQNAENVIAANRHDDQAIAPAVEKAQQSAELLIEVLAATKRPEGVINEDAARAMVLQSRQLATVNQKLGAANSEVAAQSEELTDQQKQLKGAAATLTLDKALESARKEFTPDEADVYRQGDKLLIRLKAVNFPVGRADLPSKAIPLLSKVKSIAEELNPAQIIVEGHTDSTGKAQTNKMLSQNRAEAVATYLANNGIEKDKINAVGVGYEKPLSNNKTKTGRAQNRRVDIIITPSVSATSTTNM